jgi:hypothetical protein
VLQQKQQHRARESGSSTGSSAERTQRKQAVSVASVPFGLRTRFFSRPPPLSSHAVVMPKRPLACAQCAAFLAPHLCSFPRLLLFGVGVLWCRVPGRCVRAPCSPPLRGRLLLQPLLSPPP